MDTLKILNPAKLPSYSFLSLIIFSILIVLCTRRPVSRITYKHTVQDLQIEVRIGNLFAIKGQKVISTNTTFDTDISGGVIAANSLQGQFTNKYYPQQIKELDQKLAQGLENVPFNDYQKIAGKTKQYPIGTTIRIDVASEIFYFLAMADLNYHNTAQTTIENVQLSCEKLWNFIMSKGENEPIVLPLIGTGRGRIKTNRKRLIASIAESFIKASEQHIFTSKLIIVIHPNDAEHFNINLFEVKDLLKYNLS